jgi:hypothetical protein
MGGGLTGHEGNVEATGAIAPSGILLEEKFGGALQFSLFAEINCHCPPFIPIAPTAGFNLDKCQDLPGRSRDEIDFSPATSPAAVEDLPRLLLQPTGD